MVNIYDLKKISLEQAIESILKPYSFKLKGMDVLLKPNLLGAYPPEKAVTTHPALVKTLYQHLIDIGAKPVVGDSPGGTVTDYKKAAEVSGILEACAGNFINLTGEIVEVNLKGNKKIPKIWVSKKYLEAQFIINLPKMKTHSLTLLTGSIKNLYGILPGNFKLKLHSEAPSLRDFSSLLIDIYEIRPPDINIMEAILAMEGDGPSHGKPRELDLVLSSENGVELDALTSHIMGIPPQKIVHLKLAYERGLGEIDIAKISISGDLKKIKPFKTPPTFKNLLETTLNRYAKTLSITPELKKEKCTKCGDCQKNCPKLAINLQPFPEINKEVCISCFVCVENCYQGAFIIPSVKKEFINRIKRRIIKS